MRLCQKLSNRQNSRYYSFKPQFVKNLKQFLKFPLKMWTLISKLFKDLFLLIFYENLYTF